MAEIEKKKVRQPSALKRKLQSDKRKTRNRSYKASVRTSIRSLESSIQDKEAPEAVKAKLNQIYSLMDKGVKRGIYKPQKAARTKSRLSARLSK
ncbi:MAG: 30S ribosomal protein S20 [Chlamydiae bacterium RIFCSPHIGHO2_12_FULL_44_59]|nr:MAG: 30S ribosomal protein S20 [Chlamydiae bacterium RIFCSPHIGHO2_01_FULL_44_39]OGN57589.1 MAG: 30S ribosomal protein S20 [Chlamydiae bacterium RIFCSPHIGHO2_02_FULL_45_9]OGN59948.1 MAG: 30S ribosomal protein S20 [Chlamydiae bacterium RIFCSPHIGHO2_12_FULL_44_59]OGN66163.1 MAG: 30S ribosomal protein S20 [Chlamydiae bacterium RIFCSPLOWO2_01_FULL_44_52]OGN69067.1 MAG: 30S ribosomal protein S20 [Chlamydiae bacterium RIFCSPLOWO2_02_FULL_45_22]OGN69910.1 MAG: 30S ribosomal protein S20 [Chlamydiae 